MMTKKSVCLAYFLEKAAWVLLDDEIVFVFAIFALWKGYHVHRSGWDEVLGV